MIRQFQFNVGALGVIALDCMNCRVLYLSKAIRVAPVKWPIIFTLSQHMDIPVERTRLIQYAGLNDSQGKVFDQRMKELRNELECLGLKIESIKSGVRVTHYRLTYRLGN